MKTLITLIVKLFKTEKKTEKIVEELTEEQLDAYIVSIRQKPQYSEISTIVYRRVSKPIKTNNNDLEESGCMVLA